MRRLRQEHVCSRPGRWRDEPADISDHLYGRIWSAVLAAFFAIAYDIGQILAWADLLGSGGGPESNSTWLHLGSHVARLRYLSRSPLEAQTPGGSGGNIPDRRC
jgi:hypothetical protein